MIGKRCVAQLIALAVVIGILSGGQAVTGPIRAQDAGDPVWRFAYEFVTPGEPMRVIAYSLDGAVNVLDEGRYDWTGGNCYQVGPEMAMLQFLADDEYGYERALLLLTPDAAYPLGIPLELREWQDERWVGARVNGAYVLSSAYVYMDDTPIPMAVRILVNRDTGAVEKLAGQNRPNDLFSDVGFSADGRYLRYASEITDASQSPDGEAGWKLIERTLETGEERVVYHWPDEPGLETDFHGEHWLTGETDPDSRNRTYTVIGLDGSATVVATFDRETRQQMTLLDDMLVTFVFGGPCEPDCHLEMQPLTGGDPVTLIVPYVNHERVMVYPMALIDEEHLLVSLRFWGRDEERDSEIWLVGADGSAEMLGFDVDHLFEITWLSYDPRWVLVSNEPADEDAATRHFRIWDTQVRDFVLEGEINPRTISAASFADEGVLVWENFSFHYGSVYRAADDAVFRLPVMETGRYYSDWLDGSSVLFQYNDDDGDMLPGLYRDTLDTSTFDLLVEGRWRPCWVVPFE